MSLSVRLEELADAHRQAGREERRLRLDGQESMPALKNVLQMRAVNLRRALLFAKGFAEILAGCAEKASAFAELYEVCAEMTAGDAFEEMLVYCAKYERLQTSGHMDLRLTWDGDGRIEGCELIDHRYIRVSDPDLKKRGLARIWRGEETVYPCARVYPPLNSFYGDLIGEGMRELSDAFCAMTDQILERLGGIYHELEFYGVVLRYLEKLRERGIPYCYPTLGNVGVHVRGLYDLYLALSAEDPAHIVPNDVEMTDKRGMVIFGEGGSGKTVYLRAIGAMQILAQAGLPIPCAEAEIAPCRQIATQFSEAEKDFCSGNEAGRFEQEVRELASMVDTLQDGALVLLNETFQSTAYAEGAEGLYHLLRYFSDWGIRWVLVSHLHPLEPMLDAQEAVILHTAEGFRIVEK